MMLLTSLALAAMACSSSDGGASNGDAGGIDIGNPFQPTPLTCSSSSILVHQTFPLPDGKLIRIAAILSGKVDLTTSPATLTAALADGGSVSLRWKGDAKAGNVSAYGSVMWGADGTTWCVDGESQLRLESDTDAKLVKLVIALGDGYVADDDYDSCHKPSTGGGVPPPLPATIDYEACLALPH